MPKLTEIKMLFTCKIEGFQLGLYEGGVQLKGGGFQNKLPPANYVENLITVCDSSLLGPICKTYLPKTNMGYHRDHTTEKSVCCALSDSVL